MAIAMAMTMTMGREIGVEEMQEDSVDVVALPLLAQGHIIPFMCLCDLLSCRNLNVVFLTTPRNAERLKAKRSALPPSRLRVMDIPLPSIPALPPGAENTDQLTSSHEIVALFTGMEQMEPALTQFLARLRPKCLIADFCPMFVPAVADHLKIPLFFYATMGAYGLSMIRAVVNSLPLDFPATGPPVVLLRDLPKPVSFHDSDFVYPFRGETREGMPYILLSTFFEHIAGSAGLVINTFEEMEGDFVDYVSRTLGVPVWSIGPVISRPSGDFKEGGVKDWLARRAPESVVYISFGSEIALSGDQIESVSAGLEASGQCFLWALKNPPQPKLHSLHAFKERTVDRGLVVTGWTPQQAILSHPSIGGFLSHCGWNSTLESVSNGVPVLAWPFQHDQPFVKKLLVEELRVGEEVKREAVGNGVFDVTSEEIARGVTLVIEGEEGRDMRRRARELKVAAVKAVGEGGSSFANLEKFVSRIQNIQTN